MNITYCWTEPSGYLSACISELASRRGVEVQLITWATAADAPFEEGGSSAYGRHVLSAAERNDYSTVKTLVLKSNPDVVFIVGWAHPPYVRLVTDPDLRSCRFVMGADTPIRFDWRQKIAPFKIGGLLRQLDAVCVPGDRGFQVMRYWKVPGSKITKLLYGVDYDHFSRDTNDRYEPGYQWPKRFIYAGRYVPEKGIDVLLDAYGRYRRHVADPWPLTMCGRGPLQHLINGNEGVEDRGFVQPSLLADVFHDAGVFVLPSLTEPWGQVVVEAAAACLPVVCTQACGASVEVVRDYHSGLVVPPKDPTAFAKALVWMHQHHDRLPSLGRAGQQLASAFRAQRWADNQLELAKRLCEGRSLSGAAAGV